MSEFEVSEKANTWLDPFLTRSQTRVSGDADDRCIHELFEQQAERAPRALAVTLAGEHLDYGELNGRANQLAHHLQKVGVGPEVIVGICLPRSLEMIVAVLGVMKAGGAYLPLDPNSPNQRLEFILQDGRPRVILTEQAWLKSSPLAEATSRAPAGERPAVICLDRDWEIISREPATNPASEVAPANIVYVIYTSGSTGSPKGVLIPHAALAQHSLYFSNHFDFGPADRVLQFAPLNFDVSAEEIFPALISGSTVVLRPESVSESLEQFQEFLRRERVTALNLPTSFWSAWTDHLDRHGLKLPHSLRLVVVGSEAVTAPQYAQWRLLAGSNVRWCNAYGTTETTITSTLFEPLDGEPLSVVPIGRPLDIAQAYILDASLDPVAPGTSGELHLGGGTLARGYLNRPELTARQFIPDPFSNEAGARLYKTGDLVRQRDDGNLEFLGRLDHQMKIRGFRIEAGEIEAALRQHPAVKDAVVEAREGPGAGRRLIAYYISSLKERPQEISLRTFLQERLPAYMIPSAWVKLDRFPLMPNGKLDRRALPDPAPVRPALEEEFVAPSSSLEKTLAAIWCDLLGLDRVGVQDNFFDLGGNSLTALRFCARLENELGCELPAGALFGAPRISQLAARLQNPEAAPSSSCLVALRREGSRPPLYLVHGAAGGMLWGYANLAKHLEPDQPLFAFNSRGAQGFDPFTRIEDMAAHYISELRAFQPHGPYQLGGYCFGGEVAFEMARQLTAAGQHVALLALFNASPPNSSYGRASWRPQTLLPFVRNAWHWLGYFQRWTPEQRKNLVQRKWRSLLKGVAPGRPTAKRPLANAAENTVDLSLYPEHQQKLWDIHLRASAQYWPGAYAGHITLFRTAIHPFFCSFDPACGWKEYAQGGVTVHVMPGAHESILDEPHIQSVAQCLNPVLRASARETT